MPDQLKHTIEVWVRFNEADPLGIVWHGHYIRYFEDARESFGVANGLGYLDVYEKGFVIPVVSVHCDFKKSLRYGDKVVVETVYVPSEVAIFTILGLKSPIHCIWYSSYVFWITPLLLTCSESPGIASCLVGMK